MLSWKLKIVKQVTLQDIPLLMLYVVWALTVNNIMCMVVQDMTLHSAVHRFQSLVGTWSLHFERKKLVCIHQTRCHHVHKDKNLPWDCLEHATHSELQTFPTWTPTLHLHKRPRAKYLSALYLLLCNLKYRKYLQLSDVLRNMKYTAQRAEQCSETGGLNFMGHDPVSFGRWFSALQRMYFLHLQGFKVHFFMDLEAVKIRRHTASACQEPLIQWCRFPS
jgi:hypothetical protein